LIDFRAARDGLLEVLKEATKKEINTKDENGMTPVLWAAFEGQTDSLRLLVGRGGNVDKSDQFGNTALHLSSAKGHFPCVDFLVKFGANIFALDIDNHNPQQLAAINNRESILRYLDAAAAHLEATDKKKANGFKEKAKKSSEKRIKEFLKRQQKQEDQQEEAERAERSNMLKAMKHKFWTGSHGNLSKLKDSNVVQSKDTFSALVGSGTMVQRSAAQRKIQALKQTRQANATMSDFKIGEVDQGGRTVRSIEGVRRDSEVLYVGTFQNAGNDKRGKIADVFEYDSSSIEGDKRSSRHGTLSRCLSQPDFHASGAIGSDIAEDIKNQRQSGLFDRPLLGSLSIP
jgi:Usher syndrome type-1G protein